MRVRAGVLSALPSPARPGTSITHQPLHLPAHTQLLVGVAGTTSLHLFRLDP